MQTAMIELIKDWLPPAFVRAMRNFRGVTWSGDYETWQQAQQQTSGYDSDAILAKVAEAAMKVKTGQAAYERDSVIFDKTEYSWPLLAALMWAANQSSGRLNMIDFGGSLGSTYFQLQRFLHSLKDVRWNVVEQKNFVKLGTKSFADETLRFYDDLQQCKDETNANALLLSSVIQYIEKPYDLLTQIISLGFEFVIFDRTPFQSGISDRLTIQKVPKKIYPASYPCWFFSEMKFFSFIADIYEIIAEFEALDKANIPSAFKGLILKKKRI